MPYGFPGGAATLSQLAGVTATRIVFGSATNFGTTDADLSYIVATNTLQLGVSTGAVAQRIETPDRTTAGAGSALTIEAGDGSSGAGGALTLRSGDATVSGAGANVSMNAGSGNQGGSISLTAGKAVFGGGTGSGGGFQMQSGDGRLASNGGDFTFLAGNSDQTNGTANGGSMFFIAGAGGGTSGNGGSLNIGSGASGTVGSAGTMSFFIPASFTGDGSAFTLTTGDAGISGGPQNGGNANFTFGIATGGGVDGRLALTNTASTYGIAASAGIVTPGLGPGVAVTLTNWIPVTLDGVAGFVPFYT